jgi:hypothetical protein
MLENYESKEINSLEEIEFDLIRQGKMKAGNSKNYINNKEFYAELCVYHEKKLKALENNEPIPPLSNKIGAAIIQIATRRCNSSMYRGYSNNWKDEMIGNAIMVATLLGHNFDPYYTNPFAYFTQICDNAIKQQLKSEKRELYIRYKSIDNVRGYSADEGEISNAADVHPEELDVAYKDRLNYINKFEERNFNAREMKEKKEVHNLFDGAEDRAEDTSYEA